MSSRRDRRWPGALLAALVVFAACKTAASPPRPADDAAGSARAAPVITQLTSPPASTPPATPRAGALDAPAIDLPRQESFELLDAGKGRKATLRYPRAAGTATWTVETTLSSRHLERDGFTMPTALPAFRDGFAITTAADAPGQLALRALVAESATRSTEADAYLAPWRTLLQDRRITVAVDERGQLGTITFIDDRDGARSARSRDELIQRLLATIVPLPVEPVGTGARWRVVTILRQGPAYAKQTATYTLTSRGPAAWKLRVKLQRVGEEQRVADPSLPPGTTADLLALFRLLEGDVEIDPAYPLIARGSLAIESRLHVKLQAPGQAATEQLFEDIGTAVFSLCREASAPAGAADTATRAPSAPCARTF
jgi:hypothetical protein